MEHEKPELAEARGYKLRAPVLRGGPRSHGWTAGWHTRGYKPAESQHPPLGAGTRAVHPTPVGMPTKAGRGHLRPVCCQQPGGGQAEASCPGAPCRTGFPPLLPREDPPHLQKVLEVPRSALCRGRGCPRRQHLPLLPAGRPLLRQSRLERSQAAT